ncbi:MAG TPA: transposase, partial [Coleofasciculaceae cyanobacterium]
SRIMAAKQRKYTAQFKAKVVLEVIRGEKSPADACRSYKIHNSVLTRWKREFLVGEACTKCVSGTPSV